MVTEKDFFESGNKHPYKPKEMSTEDYARQRALNEVYRLLNKKDKITIDEFLDIINRFDLGIFEAQNEKNEVIRFIRWYTAYNPFTKKKVTKKKGVMRLINPLKNHDIDGNFADTANLES